MLNQSSTKNRYWRGMKCLYLCCYLTISLRLGLIKVKILPTIGGQRTIMKKPKSINVEHKKVLGCYLYKPDHFPWGHAYQSDPLERLAQPYQGDLSFIASYFCL